MTYGRTNLPAAGDRIHADTSLLNVRLWVEAHDPDNNLLVNFTTESELDAAKRKLNARIGRFTHFINHEFGHSRSPVYWGKAWAAFVAQDIDVLALLRDDD